MVNSVIMGGMAYLFNAQLSTARSDAPSPAPRRTLANDVA